MAMLADGSGVFTAAHVHDNGDGTYQAVLSAAELGVYELVIQLDWPQCSGFREDSRSEYSQLPLGDYVKQSHDGGPFDRFETRCSRRCGRRLRPPRCVFPVES